MNTIRKSGTGVSVFLLLAVLVVPPLVPLHTDPLTSFWTEWSAGILALAAWGVFWLSNPGEFVLSRAIWPWLFWGISLGLSILTNHYDLWSPVIFAGVFWAAGLLMILLASELRERLGLEQLLFIVAVTLLFSGLLQAILGLTRFYGLLGWFSPYLRHLPSNRLEGLFNYPTIAGFSLWLSLVACTYLYWKKHIGWFGLILTSVLLSVAIIGTGNRSSVLYWFCLAFISLLVAWRQWRKASGHGAVPVRRQVLGTLLVTLSVLAAIPLFRGLETTAGPYMASLGYIHRTYNVGSMYERRKGDFWGIRGSEFRKALVMARHDPIFGIGPGNYAYHSFMLDSEVDGSVREGTINTHSHNIFSMVLAEEGVVGLLALLVGGFLVVRWWWRIGTTPEAMLVGAILLQFFAFSNLEYPLWYLNFFVIFMFFCGVLAPIEREPSRLAIVKPVFAVLVMIFGGALSWNAARGYYSISSVPQQRIASVQTARTLQNWFGSRLWAADAGVVFEQVTIPSKTDISDQLSLADQVIKHLPSPPALLHKILLLEFEGKHEQACKLATRAANSYPVIVTSYHRMLYLYSSNPQMAAGNPQSLNPCFLKGKKMWAEQWK